MDDEKYMRQAIRLAKKAAALGEVPIGCVIVYTGSDAAERTWDSSVAERIRGCEGRIIGRGYNRRNRDKCTLSHAEITAIKKASAFLGDWRLEGCTLYVTLEPCQMCAGAIVQSRIDRVVIGAASAKSGCAGSIINLLQMKEFNHQVEITRDVMAEECSDMLKDFFREMRQRERSDEAQ